MGQPSSLEGQHWRRYDFAALDRHVLDVTAVVAERFDAPAPHLGRDIARGQPFIAGAASAPIQRVTRQELHVTADGRLDYPRPVLRRRFDRNRDDQRDGDEKWEESFHRPMVIEGVTNTWLTGSAASRRADLL